MASSSSDWKSRRRQRDRIVGSSRPGAWLTRKKIVFAGGSSSIFSSALAADFSRSSMESMTTTRHGDSAGVRSNRSPERPHLIDGNVAGEIVGLLIDQPLEPAKVGMAARLDQPCDPVVSGRAETRLRRPAGLPHRQARASRPRERSWPCRRPSARREARHDARLRAATRRRTARPRDPAQQSRQAGPRLRPSRRLGDLVRLTRGIDNPNAFRLLRRNQSEGEIDLADDSLQVVRRCGRAPHCRERAPARRPPPVQERESGREKSVGDPKSVRSRAPPRSRGSPAPP